MKQLTCTFNIMHDKKAEKQKVEITHPELWQLTAAVQDTAVREAAYQAALTAYQNARTDGLCHDGALEISLAAMQAITSPSNHKRKTK